MNVPRQEHAQATCLTQSEFQRKNDLGQRRRGQAVILLEIPSETVLGFTGQTLVFKPQEAAPRPGISQESSQEKGPRPCPPQKLCPGMGPGAQSLLSECHLLLCLRGGEGMSQPALLPGILALARPTPRLATIKSVGAVHSMPPPAAPTPSRLPGELAAGGVVPSPAWGSRCGRGAGSSTGVTAGCY